MSWALFSTGKSGKREVAVSLLMLWAFVTGRHFLWVDSATHTAQNNGWETLTWASLAWAAAAFGIDFVMKSRGMATSAPTVPLRRRKADTAEDHKGAI